MTRPDTRITLTTKIGKKYYLMDPDASPLEVWESILFLYNDNEETKEATYNSGEEEWLRLRKRSAANSTDR